jgi:CHASE3 domain sensor protein
MIFILIGMALFTGIAALSESPQAVRDPQTEQALTEARQLSTELAEKVRSLLFREIERRGFVSAVRVCAVIE